MEIMGRKGIENGRLKIILGLERGDGIIGEGVLEVIKEERTLNS